MSRQAIGWGHRCEGLRLGPQRAIKVAVILGAALVAFLAGRRMSPEAVGVVVGVVCGVAAGTPSSLILLTAVGRQRRQEDSQPGLTVSGGHYPPVIVLQGGAPYSLPGSTADYCDLPRQPAAARQRFNLADREAQLF
jgi:hypothetical protein